MIALAAAAFVLTYSVFSRYLFKAGTDWQDEVALFCIVGAVFLAVLGPGAARPRWHRGDRGDPARARQPYTRHHRRYPDEFEMIFF